MFADQEGAVTRTMPSPSADMTLEEVIGRLARRPVVDGLLTIGSTGRAALTPISDYDLIVILSSMPVPLHVGLTVIDGRLADLIFVATASIDEIADADTGPVDPDTWHGRISRWLGTGTVVFDRSGRLGRAQERVKARPWLAPTSAGTLHATWFRVYYDLHQTLRLSASADPVHRTTVDLRLLFGLHAVWVGYFTVRGLLWEGDKEAVRYLEGHDPAYLARFRQCLAAGDREERLRLYTDLVDLAMAPVGERWEAGATSIVLARVGETGSDAIESALAFWRGLLADESSPP
jgi:hypothetical protein